MKNFQKGSATVTVLVVIIIVLLIEGFIYYAKNHQAIAPSTTVVNIPQSTTPVVSTQTPQAQAPVEWKTYSNASYGFSFSYPSTWKLSEDSSKKQVTINTNDIGGTNPENRDNPTYPSWTISFTATDKTFFNPPIGTKYGMISYDNTKKALVDGDRCLQAQQLFGNNPPNVNNTSSIQSITYGGSQMSDPAYSNSAILTSNGEIIIVNSQQGVSATPELMNLLSKIASSFKLLNGNTVFVPACAVQS